MHKRIVSPKRHRLLGGILASLLLPMTGCGAIPPTFAASTPTAGRTHLITEPQAGFAPWQAVLADAKTGVEVNQYLLTDRTYVHDLIRIAAHGIPVQVILDRQPYDDPEAASQEHAEFAGTAVQCHWAPARFTGVYAFDHAKYLVVNPGTSHAIAILGSANGTASAFDGDNAEVDVETTTPAITAALNQVFRADWANRPAGFAPRQALVLSPGSSSVLTTLLASSTKQPMAVATEELGDDPGAYRAMENAGARARVLVPYSADESVAERARIDLLRAAGVQVRFLRRPYLHAKLIITATALFIGSQNLSFTAMRTNREVGLITPSPTIHAQALAWFDQLWMHAQPASHNGGRSR